MPEGSVNTESCSQKDRSFYCSYWLGTFLLSVIQSFDNLIGDKGSKESQLWASSEVLQNDRPKNYGSQRKQTRADQLNIRAKAKQSVYFYLNNWWYSKKEVKAVHIIPKALTNNEPRYLTPRGLKLTRI